MSRYCLDTSAYIRFLRGDSETVAAIDGASWIGFPVIALGELHAGFRLSGEHAGDQTRLRDFLAHPVVEPIHLDPEVARQFGRIVAELRTAGTPLPSNDIWIAACAARTSSVVLTHNSRFTRIARVGCVVLGRAEQAPGPARWRGQE